MSVPSAEGTFGFLRDQHRQSSGYF